MARKIITITHPDGTKKVIISQASNTQLVKTKPAENERRAKPIMSKAGLTSTKTAYKLGGKVNGRKR